MTWEIFISYDHLRELGITISIFLLFLLFRKIFTKYIFALLLKIGRKTGSRLLPNVLLAYEKPFQWVFIVIGFYVAIRYYPYLNHADATLIKVLRSFIIYLISWGLFNLASTSSQLFKLINDKTTIQIDEILIPFLSRTLQFIIIAISLSVILQEFNYEIGGFITGLGLGGLAFSLAAKDALANLFGGIVIITEKPFTIDDWIMTPSVEGTVEDISFRSTKVRTFAQALVTVPNATLSNEPITNWSKMGKRQIKFNLCLAYETPKKTIEAVVQKIEHLLKTNPDVHEETIFVTVDDFKENGMEIFLYFFTKTTDWGEYLKIREAINLEILEILDREQVQIAIPSSQLYMVENESDRDKT